MKQPTFPFTDLDCMFLLAVMLMAHRHNPFMLRQVAKQQIKNVPRKYRAAFAMVGMSKHPAAVIQLALDEYEVR